jgi:gluconokinase
MNARDLLLAVDIGTGATKSVLFDTLLKPVHIVRRFYPVYVPHKGWTEQDADEIFGGVVAAIHESLESLPPGRQLRAIALSSQLYSVLAVGPDEKPLTKSLIWSDTRSAGAAGILQQHVDAAAIRERTGCPIDAAYPFAKIKWLQDNYSLPEGVKFISIKEYITHRLTGQYRVDWSIASATGLFNICSKQWEPACLDILGISPGNLSELVPTRAILPITDPHICKQLGVLPGMPLVIGGGDGPLASLGVGALTDDALAVNIGTSAAARTVVRTPLIDPRGGLWTYLLDEDLWVVGGMVSSGGIVFEWFLNNFFSKAEGGGDRAEDLYALVDRLAAQVPPGAEELLFIPYLSGAQAPDWRPQTRGSLTGLDLKHSRSHFARAVLEGITRSIYRIAEAICTLLNKEFREVYVTGGLAASSVWLQIAADMFGASVLVPETTEGSARGAAMLALLALGERSRMEDFQSLFTPQRLVVPEESARLYYHDQYRKFLEILEQTRKQS